MNAVWIVLPILTLLMFELGLTLEIKDFKLFRQRPYPVFVTCDKGAECSPFHTEKLPKERASVMSAPSDFNSTGTFFSSLR